MIHIVLVDLPRLLTEIVRTIVAPYPELHVVAELTGEVEELGQIEADVAVLSTESPHTLARLLDEHPGIRALVVASDGRHGFVCEPLGELSPEGITDTLREGTAP